MANLNQRKVCIIGGGAAGLCGARHFVGDENFHVDVYEQTGTIGGTWVYKDQVGLDDNNFPIHSSMYKNLRTNLPCEIMNFPDYFLMRGKRSSALPHQEILSYLNDYAQHFKLGKYINFYTRVENVELCKREDRESWMVRVRNLKQLETTEHYYDAILICNGHYFDPFYPNIPGIKDFSGQILHSHSYRRPQDFEGKIVLVLGGASSGIDIAIDLTQHAKHVYLSHNKEKFEGLTLSGLTQISEVEKFEGMVFILKDNTSIFVDAFIFSTGYNYNFNFLNENCDVRVEENYITPLYKHLINIEHPTMCFVGIPSQVIPFPMFHIQIQYFKALLKDRLILPSKEKMLEDSQLESPLKRHAHKVMHKQWEYNDSLARVGGFDPLPPLYKAGYEIWAKKRKEDLVRYKEGKLIITNDDEIIRIMES